MSQTAGPPDWRRVAAVVVAALLVPIIPFVVIDELPGERWLSNTGEDALAGPGLVLPMLLPVVGWLVWRWHGRRAKAAEN